MLTKNEKKTIRKMFHRMFVVNLQQGCNISDDEKLPIDFHKSCMNDWLYSLHKDLEVGEVF